MGPSRKRGFQGPEKTMTRAADSFFFPAPWLAHSALSLLKSSPPPPRNVPSGRLRAKTQAQSGQAAKRAQKNRMPTAGTRSQSRSVSDEAEKKRRATGREKQKKSLRWFGWRGPGVSRSRSSPGEVQRSSKQARGRKHKFCDPCLFWAASGEGWPMRDHSMCRFRFPGSHTGGPWCALGGPGLAAARAFPCLFLLRQDDSDGA